MHQNSISTLGLCPDPTGGALSTPPDTLNRLTERERKGAGTGNGKEGGKERKRGG